ncbi:glycosyltransferase family protein [Parachlamydia sp. AcF125]|uniref:glycosyltransferase family protein n=1 Tax=Parachlamydia sp. AcF125 TaxID=2795736 RepID=UPI0032D5AE97
MIIVQARMGSTRLPGKVLRPVLGQPLLGYLIERLKAVSRADDLVVATSTQAADQAIVEFCQMAKVPVVRGSEANVLSRYVQAGQFAQAEAVVRITADCPMIDPQIVDQLITFYREHADQYDYVTNALTRTFPYGMEVEVFSFKQLEKAASLNPSLVEQEHVTPVFYFHQERYQIFNVSFEKDLSRYRLTVDTPEDFQLVQRVIEALYPANRLFSLKDILLLLQQHPEWLLLNAQIQQKSVKKDEANRKNSI